MLPSDIRKAKRNVFLVGKRKNRDSLSIVATILEIAKPGAKKTKIMFSGNLSYSLLNKYLALVIDAGFLRVERSMYHLTYQGHNFLREYNDFEGRYVKAQMKLEELTFEHKQLSQRYKEILVFSS